MVPWRLALGFALAALWAPLAGAQEPSPGVPAAPSPDESAPWPPGPGSETVPDPSAALEALIEQGIGQRKAGDDRAALESFQRAYELGGSPRALAQLALAEQALGRWLDAHEHLTRALAQDHPWIREHADELRAALDDIGSELGALEVACNVDGAEVFVDGRRLGLTPSPSAFRVVAGESVIQVVAPGYFSLTRQVQVEAGGLSRVEVTLTPRGSAEADVPASDRAMSAPAIGARDASGRAEAAPWRDALMYGSLGFAGLGVATGVTGYVMREVNVKIYNDDRRCYRGPEPRSVQCPDAAEAWRLGENLMIGGLAVAGVFGALGTYLWLDRPDDGGSSEIACALGPDAFTCSGVF